MGREGPPPAGPPHPCRPQADPVGLGGVGTPPPTPSPDTHPADWSWGETAESTPQLSAFRASRHKYLVRAPDGQPGGVLATVPRQVLGYSGRWAGARCAHVRQRPLPRPLGRGNWPVMPGSELCVSDSLREPPVGPLTLALSVRPTVGSEVGSWWGWELGASRADGSQLCPPPDSAP